VRPAFFSAVCLCRDDHHPSSSRFVGALVEHAGERVRQAISVSALF
jgi:hypothetical protein